MPRAGVNTVGVRRRRGMARYAFVADFLRGFPSK
jgi:hypothetical protein